MSYLGYKDVQFTCQNPECSIYNIVHLRRADIEDRKLVVVCERCGVKYEKEDHDA